MLTVMIRSTESVFAPSPALLVFTVNAWSAVNCMDVTFQISLSRYGPASARVGVGTVNKLAVVPLGLGWSRTTLDHDLRSFVS